MPAMDDAQGKTQYEFNAFIALNDSALAPHRGAVRVSDIVRPSRVLLFEDYGNNPASGISSCATAVPGRTTPARNLSHRAMRNDGTDEEVGPAESIQFEPTDQMVCSDRARGTQSPVIKDVSAAIPGLR
jgi:hypothetical protein